MCDRFIIFTDIFSILSRSQHVCILYHHLCHSCFVHKQLAYFVSFSTNMNFNCIQQISHVSKLVSVRGMPVPHKCKIMMSCRTQIAYIFSIVSRSHHVYISFMFLHKQLAYLVSYFTNTHFTFIQQTSHFSE